MPGLAQSRKKTSPATSEDVFLYRLMGSSYVCNARTLEVEFPKAVGIAASTYAQILSLRHDSKVESVGKKKLTKKQMYSGAEMQLVTGAMQYCPKLVPEDIKAQVEEAMKKQMAKEQKKNKKKKKR